MLSLLLLGILGAVSAQSGHGCRKTTEMVDFTLGFETNYTYWDYSEEAMEWWVGDYDDDGNCIEPIATFSCDPADWSTDERNATLFTCSGEQGTCIDAALVCNGMSECPNGEDEVPGGMNCEEYECPYPEFGGIKCVGAWAHWDTKICAHMGWHCDGYPDCTGGEDEHDDCYDY